MKTAGCLGLSFVLALELFGMQEITEYVPYKKETLETRVDIKGGALAYLNSIRAEAGMILYAHNSLLENSAQNHANYLFLNSVTGHYQTEGKQGFTGVTPTDRGKYVGYKSAVSENVSFSSGQLDDEYSSIDGLMSAIYHRYGFLDFSSDQIGIGYKIDASVSHFVYNMGNSKLENLCSGAGFSGYGSYITGACSDKTKKLEAAAYDQAVSANKAANPKVVVFPPENGSPTPPVFYEESPDPLPDYGVSGYPVSIQFNDYYYKSVSLGSFKLYDANGVEITNTRILDKNSDPNKKHSTHEYTLFPLERLSFGKSYTAKITAKLDSADYTKEWSFKTREPDFPYYEAKNGDTLKVKSGQKYGIYLKPKDGNDTISGYKLSYLEYLSVKEKGFYDQNTLYITLIETQKNDQNYVKITFSDGSSVKLLFSDTDSAIYPGAASSSSTQLITLKSGWNLISLPVDKTLPSSSFLATFGNYFTIYTYKANSWDANPSSISKGEGFWINSKESSKTVSFSGNSYATNIDSLGSGWHLLGAGEKITNLHLRSGVNVVWKYSNPSGWSINPTEIVAGEGFWVKK